MENKFRGPPLHPWGLFFLVFLTVRVRASRARACGAFMRTAQLLLNELKYRTLNYPPPLRPQTKKKTRLCRQKPSFGENLQGVVVGV